MERKVYEGNLKQLDEQGQFIARVARLNAIDRDGDVTRPGAFGNHQVVPIVIGHRWDMIPVGKARLTEEGDEVLARGTLNLAMGAGRALYESLKFDLATPPSKAQFSYGFSLEDFEHGVHEGRRVRFLKSVRVHEISSVIAGAGDTALVAVKEDVASATATAVAEYERIRQRGAALAERLAKLEGLVPYRHVKMEGFTLLDPRRHLAREAAFFAAKELGIPPPDLKFFTSTDPERADFTGERMWGYAGKDGIAVEWSLSPHELVQVVAHEVGHAAGLDEPGAEEFSKSFAARHGAKFGPAPRPGGHWTYEQMAAAATWMRSQGVRM